MTYSYDSTAERRLQVTKTNDILQARNSTPAGEADKPAEQRVSSERESSNEAVEVVDDKADSRANEVSEELVSVEEVIEAGSDFQLVEQLDYTERIVCNVISEKSFIEQMKVRA